MDKQQKLEYQQKVQNYLTEGHIYEIFEDLVKNLLIKQPDDPISYLIQRLSSTQNRKIFIVGPPGFKVRQFALQVADHYKFTTISVGDLLKKQVSKKLELGQEIESYFKNYALVRDEIVINIVKKEIQSIQKEKKSFILSGFPKTRAQGLAMQRAGIFPDAFIVLNMPEEQITLHCSEKFKVFEKIMDRSVISEKNTYISNHSSEYCLNLRQIKQIYANNYFQIDSQNGNRQQILQDIARLLKFKIKNKKSRKPISIILLNSTKEQKIQVSLKLSKRYGFVQVSVRDLLNDQVNLKSEVGRLVLEKMYIKYLVDDSIINGLVQSRLMKIDCQMQGYILEGYPRTQGQLASLKDSYIQPNLIVLMEGGGDSAVKGDLLKNITQKYNHIMLKIGVKTSDEQIFEKICFELENNN